MTIERDSVAFALALRCVRVRRGRALLLFLILSEKEGMQGEEDSFFFFKP
jgi:hypothetical protein